MSDLYAPPDPPGRIRCQACGRDHAQPRVWPLVCRCGAALGTDRVTPKPAGGNPHLTKSGRPPKPIRKAKPPVLPCVHRGKPLRHLNCGCEGDAFVYACGLRGECLVRPFPESTFRGATCDDCSLRIEPASRAAIITTHFNPAGRQRLRDTYHQWAAALGHPHQCYELVLGDAKPEIPGSVAIRGDAAVCGVWQKERLINLAIERVPAEVEYVAWLDHDLIFENRDWLAIGCDMIRRGVQVVQLFHEVEYEDHCGNLIRRTRGSVAALQTSGDLANSAPGGAWMASRAWLDAIGGLYDRNICGGGDATFLHALAKGPASYIQRQTPRLRDDCLAYVDRVPPTPFGYVPGAVRHLWHGDRENRQYISRDEILHRYDFDPHRHLTINADGLLELSNAPKGLADEICQYFANRRDDG